MKEERLEILKMLQDNVISVEEAEKLLSALNTGEDHTKQKDESKKRSKHSFDGDMFGKNTFNNFFDNFDKGMSKFGKAMGNMCENWDKEKNFLKPLSGFDDYEKINIIDNQVTPQDGDKLKIFQQSRMKSCSDLILYGSNNEYIQINTDDDNSYELLKKDNTLLILILDDCCNISIPENLVDISVNIYNGDIDASGLINPVCIETLNGDIQLKECANPYYIKSFNGDIDVTIDKFHKGKSGIATLSGDISLTFPDNFSGILNASAMSGDIECMIEDNITLNWDKNFAQQKLNAEINNGLESNAIKCSTHSGDITIEPFNEEE
ncbi:MAG: DUF4097 domain-containing protein [bacterium]|nr:DUF4097 domain-containing protein [bacterium]